MNIIGILLIINSVQSYYEGKCSIICISFLFLFSLKFLLFFCCCLSVFCFCFAFISLTSNTPWLTLTGQWPPEIGCALESEGTIYWYNDSVTWHCSLPVNINEPKIHLRPAEVLAPASMEFTTPVWRNGITYLNIWRLCCQKQVSQAGISNYIPQFTVGCNSLSLPEIPASGNKVRI